MSIRSNRLSIATLLIGLLVFAPGEDVLAPEFERFPRDFDHAS